jgi:type IV secretion system protein VirB9
MLLHSLTKISTMNKKLISCCLLALISATSFPVSAQAQRNYTYKANTIYPVNAGLGIATQIVIDPSEKVRDYGTGFSAGWDLVRRENIFYIKPKDADSETNMYVRTDKRSYLFDLKIVTKDWKRLEEAKSAGVTYTVNFTYPDNVGDVVPNTLTGAASGGNVSMKMVTDDPGTKYGLSEKESLLTTITGNKSYHLDYDFSSDPASKWLVPVKVYDDGQLTFIQMRNSVNSPAFFGRSSDRGEEFLINKTLQKDTYVIQGVYPFVVIRFGSNVVGIRRR